MDRCEERFPVNKEWAIHDSYADPDPDPKDMIKSFKSTDGAFKRKTTINNQENLVTSFLMYCGYRGNFYSLNMSRT